MMSSTRAMYQSMRKSAAQAAAVLVSTWLPGILAVGLTVGLLAGDAWAQSPDKPDDAAIERSKELFLKGSEAAERGDHLQAKRKRKQARKAYARAANLFLAAYRTAPNPYFLFSLGEVYRARGDRKWSRACYRRFVKLADTFDDSKAGQAARDSLPDARRHLRKLKGRRKLTGAAKLEPVGVCTRLPKPKKADSDKPDVPFEPPPPTPPGSTSGPISGSSSQPVDKGSGRGAYRAAFFTSAGVTATALILAGVFHVQVGGSIKDDHLAAVTAYENATGQLLPFEDTCTGAREFRAGASGNDAQLLDGVIDACDRGESRALLGNTMQIVGLVGAAAAGFFLYKGYLQQGKSSRERVSIFAPVITPERVGAQWLLRF